MDIAEVARRAGVPASTLRYYEEKRLIRSVGRSGLRRVFDRGVLERLALISLGRAAGFSLEEIAVLFADDEPGRPASRALAQAKLAEIDSQMALLARAREVVEWGMACTCPSIDACSCGIHRPAAHIAN